MNTTPKTLTVTESHQLLDALIHYNAPHKSFRKGIRNHLIALLMLDAGLRVGEVVALQMSDLYYNEIPVESLVIRPEIAKTKKERVIPVSERLRCALEEYNEEPPWPGIESIGWAAFGVWPRGKQLTTRQVERIIRKAAMDSIGRPIHPHVLRHTFASRLMRKTNARIVMELLGHSQMSSTQIYMSPNGDDLKKAITEICDDPQEKHKFISESSLDGSASNSGDAGSTNHNHS